MNIKEMMGRELTRDEAIQLCNSGWWKKMDIAEAAYLQLRQDKLCMDFDDFHAGMEKLLDRPVWTHEFMKSNLERLIAEIEGKRPAPASPLESLAEIINKDKVNILEVIGIKIPGAKE